ncbi:threonylcarbamoyladenosine synthetase translation factor SUA5 [Candidatus Termititenax aidoneus]|uniref:Threonylcarbamoyl-AMP synthase n=1 Tax=Termititenax aidoneus TaxID=2218524 RepID=A0A388TDC4_TERA1|nr:threonylcarbamoyladenosine synthetase translation factor SUA5 [Candidatus Termititenax aidoneus]
MEIKRAAEIIRNGGVVAFPTETVYGLGANALDAQAVAKIFELKERPSFDPLIVHLAAPAQIFDYIVNSQCMLPLQQTYIQWLTEKFWPGPLTIVLPKNTRIPDIVTAGLPTVALRMPDNPVALELIRLSGCPLAAPSANKFGCLSPTTAEHVRKQLPELECVLDGGAARVGIESTVVSLQEDGFTILRQGAITRTDLEKILPVSGRAVSGLPSPGLLKSHYSPAKPLYFPGQKEVDKARAGLISLRGENTAGYKLTATLSPSGDLREAAANLFGALHKMEDAEIDCIVAEPVPETGIGLAIMDRLRKAAYRWKTP